MMDKPRESWNKEFLEWIETKAPEYLEMFEKYRAWPSYMKERQTWMIAEHSFMSGYNKAIQVMKENEHKDS